MHIDIPTIENTVTKSNILKPMMVLLTIRYDDMLQIIDI